MKKVFLIGFLVCFLPFLYLYYEATKLSDFKILSFTRYQYDDGVENKVTYEANRNATSYEVTIKNKDGDTLFQSSTKNSFLSIDDLSLNEEDEILIEVMAQGKMGKVKSNVLKTVWGNAPSKVRDVTSTRASGPVFGRKSIVLSTLTKDGEIHYTLDGEDPTETSPLYRGEKIELDSDMTVKAIACKDGYLPSDIVTFKYYVKSTTPVIYLSPSTQEENEGVKEAGYTTEKEMMHKIADFVYDTLKEEGFEVIYNKSVSSYKEAIKDSRKYDVDLHLAIHSNSSSESAKGSHTGIETWIYDDKDDITLELAELLQNNLFSIYYKKTGNRGVKFSSQTIPLAETNPENVNHGILIEVAFHDNLEDATWITKNVQKIGLNLAKTIISYFS